MDREGTFCTLILALDRIDNRPPPRQYEVCETYKESTAYWNVMHYYYVFDLEIRLSLTDAASCFLNEIQAQKAKSYRNLGHSFMSFYLSDCWSKVYLHTEGPPNGRICRCFIDFPHYSSKR
jgi:hypothetical protein